MECRLYLEDAPRGAAYASDEVVDLGRNWEALNFLLTGQRETDGTVASLLVADWPEIGGWEAVRVDVEALHAFSDWLTDQTNEAIFDRFDPIAMAAAGIYHASAIASDPAAARENLAEILTSLRQVALRGAQIGSAAIRVIN